jgi:hypothetical protein
MMIASSNWRIYIIILILADASFLFQGREPTDGMDQSQSDPDDDSDGDDNPIMFDIPEEIMDPVDDPGSESDQMKCFEDNDESFEPDGFPDDSALNEASNEPHSGGGNSGNVPEIISQLQKQLLKGYTCPPCPTQAPGQHTHS